MGITVIDIVFIVIILIFAVACAIKGFIKEVMSLIAAILGIVTAIIFFKAAALFLRESFMGDIKIIPEIIAFAVIFLVVFGFIKIIQLLLKGIIDGIHLGGLDHFLGFLFGCLEGVVVVCLLLFVITVIPFVDSDKILEGSFFAKFLLPFITGKQIEIEGMIASVGGSPSVGGIHV